MLQELKPGLTGTAETVVRETNTALAMGSGSLHVFATPSMIALMEQAACNAVAACLDEESTSVGTLVNITHDAATGMGKAVTATATLVEVQGRKLIFEITAADEDKQIGKGTHERFIVNKEKFMTKLG
jgi:fluoroacetyl-CoA thioesterase